MNKRFFLIVITCSLACVQLELKAQDAASPFTSMGVGTFTGMDLIQNESMGRTGIGMGSYWNINNLNPALLLTNKNTIFGELTVFQTGISAESRTIRNNEKSEVSEGSGLDYLLVGIPVVKNKWFSVLGLQPYSVANYNLNYTKPVSGSGNFTNITERGDGGFNQLYFSNGVGINKNLNIGLTAQILFGSVEKEYISSVELDGIPFGHKSTVYQRSTISGMLLKGGIAYQDSIKIKNGDPLKVTFGLVYDYGKDVNATQFESLQTRTLDEIVVESDTLVNDQPGHIYFPSGIGVGFSIGNGFKWMVGMDAGIKNYEDLTIFGESQNARDARYIRAGTEFTPDAFSIDNYLNRITYRFGLNYEELPYLINGEEVRDFGINFGISLPIVPESGGNTMVTKGFSSVDFGISYGKQGNVDNNLLEEEYFKFKFGVTFNDRWFIRRKFN